ncbi:tubulin beta chain [Sporobolomyces salmoneus]|uniref:tubulin beta chain n=1 Tax=Sporobolomyces salmoneus TaxID=183962 RepID=UPI0031808793
MRELITIQAGQAGNQVATASWETILPEHGLTDQGQIKEEATFEHTERLNVFFSEASAKKFVPRTLAVDLEPSTGDAIRSSKLGSLFRPSSFFAGQGGAANNWAKGFYTDGAEILEPIFDALRREAENCDLLQGFQLVHSIGGGTGSGLGCLLLNKIREEYPDRMLATYSVLPSPKVSETVVEPYNAVLSFNQLIDHADMVFTADNEQLYNILHRNFKQENPAYPALNALIARVMSGISTPFRFSGQLNSDLRKLGTNLVPFPRLHFFTTSYAPLVAPGAKAFERSNVADIISELMDSRNQLAAADVRSGKFLTVACYLRGRDLSSREVDEAMSAIQQRNRDFLVEWIPHSSQTALCSVPALDAPVSGTMISNNTCIQDLFRRTHDQFSRMFSRKAFLHPYQNEGMDEMEFTEAEYNLIDLVEEYQQYQDAGIDEDECVGEIAEGDGFAPEETDQSFVTNSEA